MDIYFVEREREREREIGPDTNNINSLDSEIKHFLGTCLSHKDIQKHLSYDLSVKNKASQPPPPHSTLWPSMSILKNLHANIDGGHLGRGACSGLDGGM